MTGRTPGTTPRGSPAGRRAIVGALLGAVAGAVVAVNIVIFSGIDSGYETTLPQVFADNVVVGVITVLVLVAGPVIGAMWAMKRGRATTTTSMEDKAGTGETSRSPRG